MNSFEINCNLAIKIVEIPYNKNQMKMDYFSIRRYQY